MAKDTDVFDEFDETEFLFVDNDEITTEIATKPIPTKTLKLEEDEENSSSAKTTSNSKVTKEKQQFKYKKFETLESEGTKPNKIAGISSAKDIEKIRARKTKRDKELKQQSASFDIKSVLEIGCFSEVLLFGNLDCYRDNATTGLVLDGNSLSQAMHKLVSGICRLRISVEGVVKNDDGISRGFANRINLKGHTRRDSRLDGFIGIDDIRKEETSTKYYEIAYADCDVMYNTDDNIKEMEELIYNHTKDIEEQILDLHAIEYLRKYKENYMNVCSVSIARLYVNPTFRHLGLSKWLLKNLPILCQTVVNKPVADMFLIPGDFSSEAKNRNITKQAYTNWLKGYYERNNFKLDKNGIYRRGILSID